MIKDGADTTLLGDDPLARRLMDLDTGPIPSRLAEAVALGRAPARRRRIPRRPVAVFASVVVISAVATPALAVAERSVLPSGVQQLLGLAAGIPQPSTAQPTSTVRVDGSAMNRMVTPKSTLQQAAAQVSFAIPTPRVLPPGVSFRGALVESPQVVYLHYASASGGGVNLLVHQGAQVGGSSVPLDVVQRASVLGQQAFFVHGAYENSPGPGDPGTWNPNADDEELTWAHAGMTFNLTAGGLGLTMADMVSIAESVR